MVIWQSRGVEWQQVLFYLMPDRSTSRQNFQQCLSFQSSLIKSPAFWESKTDMYCVCNAFISQETIENHITKKIMFVWEAVPSLAFGKISSK